jgi:hypothetical protein
VPLKSGQAKISCKSYGTGSIAHLHIPLSDPSVRQLPRFHILDSSRVSKCPTTRTLHFGVILVSNFFSGLHVPRVKETPNLGFFGDGLVLSPV